jgi:hypothetical protein
VDKRKVGEGSTSTNTALIQYTGEESFISLKNTFGEEAAARQLKLCEQSINHIEPFSKSEGVRIYGVLAKIVTHKIMHGSSPDSDLYLQNRPLVEKKHSNSFHVPWKRAVRQNNVRTLLNFRFLLMVYYNAKSRFHIYFWNRLLTMISQNILLPSIVTG